LPIERELSLAHAQRCSFQIVEQRCSNIAVEKVPKNSAFSGPILPRELELSLEQAQRCSFLIMEQRCGHLAVEIFPGKHCDFSTYLAKKARDQSGACAEEQFPDYGTVLWSTCNRIDSKISLRFQQQSCQENWSSVWRMRIGAVS
jgi:hypothetical protein